MVNEYGFSELDCKIIKSQIERRAKYRKEFLKLRTDPAKHAAEAGHVFDPAIQHFLSMKTCEFDYFKACTKTVMYALKVLVPMFVYGALIYNQREEFLKDCRCGKIKYRDRLFKFN